MTAKSSHPSYEKMATEALTGVNWRKGLSRSAIFKYCVENYEIPDEDRYLASLSRALKKGLEDETFAKVKGVGLGGSFKLPPKSKAVKKSVTEDSPKAKKQVKKTSVKSPAKKASAKSPAKKKAPAKKLTTPKKAAAKKIKTPVKKVEPKKPTVKKPVSAKPKATKK